jgi:hypothetical protein
MNRLFMKQTLLEQRNNSADRISVVGPNLDRAVNVALVFQDGWTRQRAGQARDQLTEILGVDGIHCTEWKISDLRQPGTFSEGAAALARADVIVVSVQEAERLPSVFYVWVNLWLQERSGLHGTLVGLVLPSAGSNSRVGEMRRYLCAVASQAGLELLESNDPDEPIRALREDLSHSPKAPSIPISHRGFDGQRLAAKSWLVGLPGMSPNRFNGVVV